MLELCFSYAPLLLTMALVGKAGSVIKTFLNKLISQLCFHLILSFGLKIPLMKGSNALILTVLYTNLGCLVPSFLKASFSCSPVSHETPT